MRFRAQLAAVLALAGATACQEPPSYRLRWAIDGRERLDTIACAESGLFQVRVRAHAPSMTVVDERLFPCFPEALRDEEGLVDGSPLPPGVYSIEVRGVDRTGNPWSDLPDDSTSCPPEGQDVGCHPSDLACDCQRIQVEEGETLELPEFVLAPPPECVDGIDNDHDGLVDVNDPSCNVDFGDGTESVPVGVTELRLELGLLHGNPAVSCSSTPLRRLRVEIGSGDDAEVVLEEPCVLDRPYLASLRLPAGTAVFSAVGLDAGGEPVTMVEQFETEISPIGGTVRHTIDFGPEDFLEPIVREIRASPGYVSERGRASLVRYSCEPRVIVPASEDTEAVTRGRLVIAGLRPQVLNSHGGPLDVPATLDDGSVLDGQNVIACSPSLVTAPLEWGGFTMQLEALSPEGEVCFSNVGAPTLMSPGGVSGLFLPRVYDAEGNVPASCHDCAVDADCGLEGELFCVDGVCQGRCASDDECGSDELGDLGFVCADVDEDPETETKVCRRAG
jgi:hypothetical protein